MVDGDLFQNDCFSVGEGGRYWPWASTAVHGSSQREARAVDRGRGIRTAQFEFIGLDPFFLDSQSQRRLARVGAVRLVCVVGRRTRILIIDFGAVDQGPFPGREW